MESPNVARSLYVYKSQLATHRQIIKQFSLKQFSLLESSELKSWHNLTVFYLKRTVHGPKRLLQVSQNTVEGLR